MVMEMISDRTYLNWRSSTNFSTAAGVVQPSDERPEKFNASGEHLSEIGQQYKKYRYAEYRVHDCNEPASIGRWSYVPVT